MEPVAYFCYFSFTIDNRRVTFIITFAMWVFIFFIIVFITAFAISYFLCHFIIEIVVFVPPFIFVLFSVSKFIFLALPFVFMEAEAVFILKIYWVLLSDLN